MTADEREDLKVRLEDERERIKLGREAEALQLDREKFQYERRRSVWGVAPGTAAVVAALLGVIGTLIGSCYNTRTARDKDRQTAEHQLKVEQQRQQGTLILEAIKTRTSKEAAANLLFFSRARLLTFNAEQRAALEKEAGAISTPHLPIVSVPTPGSAAETVAAMSVVAPFETGREVEESYGSAYAAGREVFFGLLPWSAARDLPSYVTAVQSRDPQLLRRVLGDRSQTLIKIAATDNEDARATAIAEEMVADGHLKPAWRKAFEQLGADPVARDVQLKLMQPIVEQARKAASAYNMRSQRGYSFCVNAVIQMGRNKLERLRTTAVQCDRNFATAIGRPPDEAERLAMLAVTLANSIRAEQFRPAILRRYLSIAIGEGVGIPYVPPPNDMTDKSTGKPIAVHGDRRILERIKNGEFQP